MNTIADENAAERVRVFGIPIENQIALAAQEAVIQSVRFHVICAIHRLSGGGVIPANFTARRAISMKIKT